MIALLQLLLCHGFTFCCRFTHPKSCGYRWGIVFTQQCEHSILLTQRCMCQHYVISFTVCTNHDQRLQFSFHRIFGVELVRGKHCSGIFHVRNQQCSNDYIQTVINIGHFQSKRIHTTRKTLQHHGVSLSN